MVLKELLLAMLVDNHSSAIFDIGVVFVKG
jgi:hypothetical protein